MPAPLTRFCRARRWSALPSLRCVRLSLPTPFRYPRNIAEAIVRIHRGQSVGALFTSEVHVTQEMLLWDMGSDSGRPAAGGNGQSPAGAGPQTASETATGDVTEEP